MAAAGLGPYHMRGMANLLATCMYAYFARACRFEQALQFFWPLASAIPACALQAASAQRELGLLPEAIITLGRMLDRMPSDPQLLIAQCELLLECEMLKPALRIASLAVELGPHLRPAWLLLVRAQLANGEQIEALRTLNAIPVMLAGAVQAPRCGLYRPLRSHPRKKEAIIRAAVRAGRQWGAVADHDEVANIKCNCAWL